MIVLNPDNSTHDFKIIPRSYSLSNVVMELYNEETSETTTEILTKSLVNGYLECSFTKTLQLNASYRIKLYNSSNNFVYYNGKIFCTNQSDLQNFRITKNYFEL